MLRETSHDIGTAVVAILAGLVAAAFFMPGWTGQPSSRPVQPRSASGSAPTATPSLELSVFDAARQYSWSLTRALDAWNVSGARIRFVAVAKPTADVTVTLGTPSACGPGADIAACTDLGHSGPRTIWIVQRLDRYAEAEVLTHELGHVLGLGHDRSGDCAAMTPSLWQNCESPPHGEWRCRLLERSDIESAIATIGGVPRPSTGPLFCPVTLRGSRHRTG